MKVRKICQLLFHRYFVQILHLMLIELLQNACNPRFGNEPICCVFVFVFVLLLFLFLFVCVLYVLYVLCVFCIVYCVWVCGRVCALLFCLLSSNLPNSTETILKVDQDQLLLCQQSVSKRIQNKEKR
jgi:hypothetical protein